MDFDRLIRAAQEKWGGRWKVMVRLHPNLLGMDKKMRYSKDVINVSNYPDINELISICDILITDYSSCMFDALNIEKNVILYAIDIEEYRRDRDTYFSMNSLPFPLAKDEDELIEIILNFNEENYVDQINNFKKEYRIFDDGRASERIVEKIRKELKIEPRSS
jgi:CDP-glycerol glycerophosphotransferase